MKYFIKELWSLFHVFYRTTPIVPMHVNSILNWGCCYYSVWSCIIIIYLLSLEDVGFVHLNICTTPADLQSFQRNRVHKGTSPPTQPEDEGFCRFTKYTVFLFFCWILTNNWPQEAAGPCPQRAQKQLVLLVSWAGGGDMLKLRASFSTGTDAGLLTFRIIKTWAKWSNSWLKVIDHYRKLCV
jgi:hypothetical protein